MAQVGQRFDAASPACQHDAVDDGAGPGSLDGVAEEPRFSAVAKILMSRSTVLLSGMLPSASHERSADSILSC